MPLPAPQPVAITQPSPPPPISTSEQSVVVSDSDDHGGHGATMKTTVIKVVMGATMKTTTITIIMGGITIEPALHSGAHRLCGLHCRDPRPSHHDDSRVLSDRFGDPPSVSEPSAIEDLDPSVQKLLQVDGWARVLTTEELATIPAAVARTLIEHDAALTLPSGGNQ